MKKLKPGLRLVVNREYRFGYIVRVVKMDDGEISDPYLLQRTTGLWVRTTHEQLQENDIRSDCLFPVDELPESSDFRPT